MYILTVRNRLDNIDNRQFKIRLVKFKFIYKIQSKWYLPSPRIDSLNCKFNSEQNWNYFVIILKSWQTNIRLGRTNKNIRQNK